MSIDIILFTAFLSLNLVLGLLAGRRVKNLREFSIGTKTFSTSTVTSTIVATWISGGFMFYALQNIYTNGLKFIIVTMAGSLCLLFMGQVLAVRMGEFLNNLSVAEAIGDLYGKKVRIISAITGIIKTTGQLAVQFKVIAKMLTLLLGFEGSWVTVLAAGIVILYSAFGGIRSVTITDIFQFITFSVFVPILALVIWNNLKNPGQVTTILDTSPLFSWKTVVGWNTKTLSMLGLLIYFALPSFSPAIFQRIAIAKDIQQVRDSFTYAAGIRLLIVLGVAWVAILLLADPSVQDPKNLVNHLISHYAYPGLKGLIAIGIVAMAMSTADSNLNAAAVLCVNDIIKPNKKNWQESMLVVRLASIGLGLIGLILALSMQNILDLLLFSSSLFVPIVEVPLLLAIFGFRSKPRAVLIGMAAGFVTVFLWSIFLKNSDSIIPGMLANLMFLIGSHYLLKEQGGWVGIRDKEPLLAARQKRKEFWHSFLDSLRTLRIYKYLKKNIPVSEAVYSLFGVYVIGATYTSFFTVPESVVVNHEVLYNFLAHSTLIATAIFITYPAWPLTFRAKWFIAFAWPIGVTYLLFVVGAILVMMSGFHQVQVMIFMLNLIIAALLLPWPLVTVTSIMSIILARIIFHTHGGEITVEGPVASLQFKIFYSVLLFSGSLIAIVRFRQSKKSLEERHEHLIAYNQETSTQLLKALSYEERFIKALGIEGVRELEKTAELSKEVRAYIENVDLQLLPIPLRDTLTTLKNRINTTAQYLGDISHRATTYLHLDVTNIPLKNLVHEVSKLIEVTELPVIPQIIVRIETSLEEEPIECDVNKIKKLLFNAIIYAQTHLATDKPVILLGIEATNLGYAINSIEGYTKKVPAVRFTVTTTKQLPPHEPLYLTSMEQPPLQIPLDQQSLVLFSNQRVLQAHYGYMAVEIDSKVATQVYVIPQQIRDVRPKEMDIPELEPDAFIKESDETYPGAKEQEQSLLKALKLENEEDFKMIHKAIRLIKKYHGPVKRKSGEPFYLHPIAVAKIILDYTDDVDTIIGALLHDTVEDTALTLSQIELMFNTNVKNIVDGVTHLDSRKKTIYKVKLAAHENIKQLLEVEDKRVLYVKLADRMHNMRTIQYHSSLAKRKTIAEETLQFFVPVAQYLGLSQAADELKSRSFEVLNQ
jgi:Na+/proline symporter